MKIIACIFLLAACARDRCIYLEVPNAAPGQHLAFAIYSPNSDQPTAYGLAQAPIENQAWICATQGYDEYGWDAKVWVGSDGPFCSGDQPEDLLYACVSPIPTPTDEAEFVFLREGDTHVVLTPVSPSTVDIRNARTSATVASAVSASANKFWWAEESPLK